MPLEIISSDVAWDLLLKNKYARYPSPKRGGTRLYPLATPEGKPSFKIHPDARIFTMGSCFALEVDNALSTAGFTVTSRSADLSQAVERKGRDEALYNKYTVPSMLNEI